MIMSYWEMMHTCDDTCLIPLFTQEQGYNPYSYHTLAGIREEEGLNKKYSKFSNVDFDRIDDEELYNLMVDNERYRLIFVQNPSIYEVDYMVRMRKERNK